MKDTKGIIMFHVGRSGSTVLSNLLSQNPVIEWEVEPFENLAAHNQKTARQIVRWLPIRIAPFHYLHKRRKRSVAPFYGFDIKFYHLSDRGIELGEALKRLGSQGFERIISLKRKNLLRKIVSSVSALQQGSYHLGTNVRSHCEPVFIDPNAVLIDGDNTGLAERFQRWQDCFEALEEQVSAFRSLTLTYEDDILVDPQAGYRRVCEFLEVEPGKVTVRHSRTTPTPLHQMVRNWNQICDALAGTKWEWMLDESGS